jgi:hypothetical protein
LEKKIMGRSNDALRKANDSIRDFVALVNQEVIDVISEAIPTGTLSSTHTTKRPLNGMNEINVYLCCTGANIVAVDTLTFKFYIREKINGVEKFNEIYQAANYTVLTTGVTADQVRKYSVTDSDSIIKSATHYSVASTAGIAMPALCYATLAVGKAHDIDSAVSIPTIVGNATAAITEASSTVTLTHKSEVRNTGLNTVYLAEGSGTAVAATDFPLYPDETITLKAGTFDAICGAGLTSTLSILKVS